MSYADFSQILMGAVAITLGALALVITVGGAVLGFLGYRAIKKSAASAAQKAVNDKLAEYFEGEALPQKIKDAITLRIAEEVDLHVTSAIFPLLWSQAQQAGIPERPIADDYPDK